MEKSRNHKSVFISSTYKDLIPIRKLVVACFEGSNGYSTVKMENFPSDAMQPSLLSLNKINGTDIFVLILGHKYGTIPEELNISITHKEYREAKKLYAQEKLENIYVFIATDDFKIRSSDIEDDFKRQKLKEFKAEITETPRYFTTEEEIKDAVYQTIINKVNHLRNERETKVFNSLTDIINLIDRNVAKSKQNKVDDAVLAIAKSFEPVFKIGDSNSITEQPILNKIREILNEYIPNIVFEERKDIKGRIDRWGIRHVIFRADTAIRLMQAIDPDDSTDELERIGYGIGENASRDLFAKLINPRTAVQPFIPKKFGAFIELLNYWDSSGGWGELKHVNDTDELEKNGIRISNPNTWILRTENNFLADEHSTGEKDEKEDIKHLYKFWKGYIHGVLNRALKELDNIYALLSEEYKEQIDIPKYIKVISVNREEDNDRNRDYFSVVFNGHEYSSEINILGGIKTEIEAESREEKGGLVTNRIASNLRFVLEQLKQKNTDRYIDVLKKFSDDGRHKIEKITSPTSGNSTMTIDELRLCERAINLFLQEFIHSR